MFIFSDLEDFIQTLQKQIGNRLLYSQSEKKEISMNMKNLSLLTVILSTTVVYPTDAIITMFLQKYPYFKTKTYSSKDLEKYSKKLRQPGYIYKKMTDFKFSNGISGITCFYAGLASITDHNGQITFPRQQQTPDINLLVTTTMLPGYIVAPTTINTWMIEKKPKAKMYSFKLQHDQKSMLLYYQTQEIPMPADNKIPLTTIILIADPDYVYVPAGATIVNYSPNIILPTIYIKKGFCFIYNSLYSLAIKQYFDSTKSKIKQDETNVAVIQTSE